MTPIDPRDADRLRALDGEQVHFKENLGASDKAMKGNFSVPSSLLAARLACPDCGSAARDEDGDALDLLHLPGCTLAGELGEERTDDLVRLADLAAEGAPRRFKRTSTDAEVELRESEHLDAAGGPVVVSGTPGGGRERWWPTLDPAS